MAKKPMDERAARLTSLCNNINKGTFGGEQHDAVTFLGSTDIMAMERWTSGCIELDYALGGGWPKGRFIELFGSESGGKCLVADTFVMGQHGLMTVSEVFVRNGFVANAVTKSVEHAYPLVDEKGCLENTTHFYWNYKKPVVRIETKHGLVMESTERHPVRVVKNGMVQWKHSGNIEPGDHLLVGKGMMIAPPDNGMDEDDGAFLGLIISEGHTQIAGKRIGFTNEDAFLLSEFKRICHDKFGFTGLKEYSRDGNTIEIHMNKREVIRSIKLRYGLKFCLSGEKDVPLCIRTSSLNVQRKFLQMFFAGDGGKEDGHGTRSRLSMSSKSWDLLHQIQLLALNFGAFGHLRKKVVNGVDYWVLRFDGEEAICWETVIGRPEKMSRKWLTHSVKNASDRGIPSSSWIADVIMRDCVNPDRALNALLGDSSSGKCDLSTGVVRKILKLDQYKFGPAAVSMLEYLNSWITNGWDTDEVVSVCDGGIKPTFDFTKSSHTFWSNGVISHNTTLALQAIAEHQKKYVDEDVGFIDSEYALDETYAKALGVDMRYMLVNQPDSGEQALNVLSQMVMGGVKLIVVDSVAALTTKAELEGDIGDIHVGQQARLMSTALRRLVQETGSRNSTVIWTNQMRDKIGVMYGDRTTTPAGHALKHYASIRVHVARIGTVKEEINGKKVAVCNKTKADVKKNKCSPPFRVAEFYITYGYGVDRVAGILDAALELGVAEKRGAWFSFDGEQLGQGRLSTLDRMRGDEELSKKIMDAVQVAKDSGVKAKPTTPASSFRKPKSMGKKNNDPDAIDSEETSVEDA